MRFAPPHKIRFHELEVDAIGRSPFHQHLELRALRRLGEDQFADSPMRHTMACAVFVEPPMPVDTQPCFQRSRRIVDPRVNNAGIVSAGLHAETRMAFQETHREVGSGYRAGGGKAGHASADNRNVHTRHWPRYIIRKA